jgi:hypothetical protein
MISQINRRIHDIPNQMGFSEITNQVIHSEWIES